jgi:hypothetical protein
MHSIDLLRIAVHSRGIAQSPSPMQFVNIFLTISLVADRKLSLSPMMRLVKQVPCRGDLSPAPRVECSRALVMYWAKFTNDPDSYLRES